MSEYYVGLDVHSKQSVFVIEDSEGAVQAEGTIPSCPSRKLDHREISTQLWPALVADRSELSVPTGTDSGVPCERYSLPS